MYSKETECDSNKFFTKETIKVSVFTHRHAHRLPGNKDRGSCTWVVPERFKAKRCTVDV